MLRQDAVRFMLEKYLSDKKIPWHRRRRLGIAVAGNTPTASFLTKIGKMQSAGCQLCRIAPRWEHWRVWQLKHTATSESTVRAAKEWQWQLQLHTTPSGGTCMTACTLHKTKSKLKFVTLDKESNISTLWRREEFLRICSKEELAEKAQDIEVTIPVKNSQRHGTTSIQSLSL